jgi:hypothetical protein
MVNSEKLATRRIQTKQKHNTICVRHHYPQTSIDNVNKTLAFLQITGGKDELQSVREMRQSLVVACVNMTSLDEYLFLGGGTVYEIKDY